MLRSQVKCLKLSFLNGFLLHTILNLSWNWVHECRVMSFLQPSSTRYSAIVTPQRWTFCSHPFFDELIFDIRWEKILFIFDEFQWNKSFFAFIILPYHHPILWLKSNLWIGEEKINLQSNVSLAASYRCEDEVETDMGPSWVEETQRYRSEDI